MQEQQTDSNQPTQQVTTPIKPAGAKSNFVKIIPFLVIIILIVTGVFSGAILASRSKSIKSGSGDALNEKNLTPEKKEELQVVTRDEAEGVLEKNDDYDIYAQGQWKLIRPGGESQTAYLTSSYIDLDEHVGKKVKVFGETLGTDQVGWLLDVAKIEVLE